MKATVIIPNYNGIEYLENCIQSILEGTVLPKIIVVDNGSTDGSRELVEKKFPRVKLIALKENTGFCRAVNEGIRAAQTMYVILLNNDTKIEPDMVRQLMAVMDRNEDAFSASAKMLSMKEPDLVDDAGDFYNALGWAFARGKGKPATTYPKSDRIFASCAGAAIYRRRILEQIGFFDECHFAYLEDIDIGYRARIFGYANYYAPLAVVYHAGSAVSGSRYNEFKARLSARNNIYLIYKNMPLFQMILNLPFLIPGFLLKTLFFYRKNLGKTYVQGILEGFKLSASQAGKKNKVVFKMHNLGSYCRIQCELWANIPRRFIEN